jgi:hypothetical protein
MSERERFEKWVKHNGVFLMEEFPTIGTVLAWEAWQAALLSTRKPYGYGIVDKDGKPYFEELCVADDEGILEATVLRADSYDRETGPHRTVPLFYEEES